MSVVLHPRMLLTRFVSLKQGKNAQKNWRRNRARKRKLANAIGERYKCFSAYDKLLVVMYVAGRARVNVVEHKTRTHCLQFFSRVRV